MKSESWVALRSRHPEAAESLAKPRTANEGSLHFADATRNEGCPIFRALCERWEPKLGVRNSSTLRALEYGETQVSVQRADANLGHQAFYDAVIKFGACGSRRNCSE